MKRAGDLYDSICSIENLESAFWKAQRGKSRRPAVVSYRENLRGNLERLRHDLIEENVSVGRYTYFPIFDPKERVICAAPFNERVLHHAIINVAGPCFERYSIFDSFACRKGKGVDAALARARHFARRHKWFVKLDVVKFFDSIDHDIMKRALTRRFKDRKLLCLFERIVDSYSSVTGENQATTGCAAARGLPIGNLTSQYFANLYLGETDHRIKDSLRVRGYLRYMDDMVIFADSVEELRGYARETVVHLRDRLALETHEPVVNKTSHGVPFLSYLVTDTGLRLSAKAKTRFRRKIKEAVKTGDPERGTALVSFLERADCRGFMRKVFEELDCQGGVPQGL